MLTHKGWIRLETRYKKHARRLLMVLSRHSWARSALVRSSLGRCEGNTSTDPGKMFPRRRYASGTLRDRQSLSMMTQIMTRSKIDLNFKTRLLGYRSSGLNAIAGEESHLEEVAHVYSLAAIFSQQLRVQNLAVAAETLPELNPDRIFNGSL